MVRLEAGEVSSLFLPLFFLVLGALLDLGNIPSLLSVREVQVGPTLLASLVEEDT